MKKIVSKFKDINNIIYIYLVSLILGLSLGSFLMVHRIFSYSFYSYILYFFGAVAALLYILFLILKKIRINIFDIFIYLLIIFAVISTVYAYNVRLSLFGLSGWNEGLFSVVSYYSIFLLTKNLGNEYKLKVLKFFVYTGLLYIAYAFLQVFDFEFLYQTEYNIGSVFTSCNYFSSFCVLLSGFSIGLYVVYNEKKYFIISLFYIFGILVSNTTSGILALGIIFIFLLIKKKWKAFFFYYLCSIIIFLIIGFFIDVNMFIEVGGLLLDVNLLAESTNNITRVGNHRGYIYSVVMDNLNDNLLNGIGLDNVVYVDNGNPILMYNPLVMASKVHSEPLQILITQGIFAFVVYVIFYLYTLIKSFFMKNSTINIILLGIIPYIFQGFFNISVLQVFPFFILFFAFLTKSE